MNLYLLVVVLTLPPLPSGLKPDPMVLHRGWVGGSKIEVCQAEGSKLAAQYLKANAEEVARMKPALSVRCTLEAEGRQS